MRNPLRLLLRRADAVELDRAENAPAVGLAGDIDLPGVVTSCLDAQAVGLAVGGNGYLGSSDRRAC